MSTITDKTEVVVPRLDFEHCALFINMGGYNVGIPDAIYSDGTPQLNPSDMNLGSLWNSSIPITAMRSIAFCQFRFGPGEFNFNGEESLTEEIDFTDCK